MFVKALVVLFFCFFCNGTSASPKEKLIVLVRANELTVQLLSIARQRMKIGKNSALIKGRLAVVELLNKERDVDVLVKVSALSKSNMAPGRAEDQIVDDVFDEAWHACVQRIEGIGGANSIAALKQIALEQSLDGAYSIVHSSALARLQAKEAANATARSPISPPRSSR